MYLYFSVLSSVFIYLFIKSKIDSNTAIMYIIPNVIHLINNLSMANYFEDNFLNTHCKFFLLYPMMLEQEKWM